VKVTILGTGAMACLIGSQLASFADITLLGTWLDAIQAIRRDGIRVRYDEGVKTASVSATDSPETCRESDLVIVLVKSQQTRSAVVRAAEILKPEGLALTLQNGIGNREALVEVFGADRSAAGITTMGAYVESPGAIRFGGEGVIWLERHPRIQPAFDVFRKAGFEVGITDDLQSQQWGKLVVNSGLNTLTALLRVTNGCLADLPVLRSLYLDVVRESAAVATAAGITLPYADTERMAIEVATRTHNNRSSMLQDMENGRELEIEAITGAILQTAERAGVEAPLNRMLYGLLLSAADSRTTAAPSTVSHPTARESILEHGDRKKD
jgi:2-dehydropantoate 2-reductase